MKEQFFKGRKIKKLISLVLALAMVLTLMPLSDMTVYADSATAQDYADASSLVSGTIAKGQTITIDSKSYLVLSVDGTKVKVLAKYNATDTQKFHSSSNAYFGSDVDNYLTNTYLPSLSFKDALVDTSITQYKYSYDLSVYNATTHASYADYSTKTEVATQNRKVFLLDVADVEEYLGSTYSTTDVQSMFASSSYYWLRSAYAGYSGFAFFVFGDYGHLDIHGVEDSSAVRPAFVLDLSLLPSKTSSAASHFTFTAPSTLTAGAARSASVTTSESGMGTITVYYSTDKTNWYTTAPSAAGTYYVAIDVTEGTSYTAGTKITADAWTFTLSPSGTTNSLTSALENNDSFTLTEDMTLDSEITITKDFTLDLGGKTLKIADSNKLYGLAAVNCNNITIKNGTLDINKNVQNALYVSGTTLNLEDVQITTKSNVSFFVTGNATVNLKGESSIDKCFNGTSGTNINISGGTYNFTNIKGKLGEGALSLDSCAATVTITGGTYRFDPSAKVSDNYQVIFNDSKYVVKNILISTQEELEAIAKEGTTGSYKLANNLTVDKSIVFKSKITLDLDNHTLSNSQITMSTLAFGFTGETTIKNGTLTCNVPGKDTFVAYAQNTTLNLEDVKVTGETMFSFFANNSTVELSGNNTSINKQFNSNNNGSIRISGGDYSTFKKPLGSASDNALGLAGTLEICGGTYGFEPYNTYVKKGLAVNNGNGTYTIMDVTAFEKVQMDINNTGENGTVNITLDRDYIAQEGDKTIKIENGRNVTIDTNVFKLDANGIVSPIFEVAEGATLTLVGHGEITGADGTYAGGAIALSGKLVLDGPTITGNKTSYNGGAVYMYDGTAEFIMNSGAITNNEATGQEGNDSSGYGGAIRVGKGNTFRMNGGEITGNKAIKAAAVFINQANVSLLGGTITGNTSEHYGAVTIDTTVTVGGDIRIIGNTTNELESNLFLRIINKPDSQMNVSTEKPLNGALIGISLDVESDEQLPKEIGIAAKTDCLKTDNDHYVLQVKEGKLSVSLRSMTVSSTNGTATYDGTATSGNASVSVTTPSSGATIKYGTVEGTYNSDSIPTFTDAGEHTVYYKVTATNYTDYTGSFKITISKANQTLSFANTSVTKMAIKDTDYTQTVTGANTTVSYASSATDVATVDSTTGKVTILKDGTATITATATSNDNYKGATASYTLTVTKDETAPTVDIKISTNSIKKAFNAITFGLFFKETQSVSITSEDADTGIDKTYYHVSNEILTEDKVKALTSWTEGTSLSVNPNNNYVVYVKVTDKAGNVTYAGSDGLVIDNVAPVITGIESSKTYCAATEFTVTETNLDNVKIDEALATAVNGKYTLPADGKTHTVTATDKAGNVTTITNVKANGGHIYDQEVVDAKYLKSSATCQAKAVYYKSCECGAKGTETFESGEYAEHTFGTLVAEVPATHMTTGTKAHYVCSVCNKNFDTDKKTELTDLTIAKTTAHTYNKEVATADYLKSAATCKSKAVYYKSCECGAKGTETFEYGKLADHDFSGEWTVVKEATSTTDGKKETTCKYGCGTKKVETIPATGSKEDDSSNGNLDKDAQVASNAPVDSASLDNSKTELMNASGIFTEAEKTAIKNGQDAKVYLQIENVDKADIPSADQNKIESAADNALGKNSTIEYMDVSLFKQVGDADAVSVHEPGTDIKVTIEISSSMLVSKKGMARKYRILRLHDGKVETISGTFDFATNEFTFSTDKFSTYAIAYSDEEMEIEISTPKDSTTLGKIGDTLQLSVTVTPADDANQKVTYKTSDEKVATVDKNGKVTAVGNGTATITVTTADGSVSKTITITVDTENSDNNSSNNENTTSPKTGDTNDVWFWLLLMIAGLGIIGAAMLKRKED